MYFKKNSLFTLTLALLLTISVNAQVYEITVNGFSTALFGDFAEDDFSNNNAGYSTGGIGVGLEFHVYWKNNLGLGLRSSSSFYAMDREEYETDLLAALNVTTENQDFADAFGYVSFGAEIGMSYLFDLSEKVQLEPYFYIGSQNLASPRTEVVYLQSDMTYTYDTRPSLFGGFSYSPGVRLKWNIQKHIGLNFFAEYKGTTYSAESVTSIKKSYNTLEISEVEKSYSLNAVNAGIGLSFRFGKGLSD